MQPRSQFSLLRERRFGPFFLTQFLGALNDNVFKTALLTVLTYHALSWTTIDPAVLNNLIPGLFILPYLLFSATAGQLAEKFDKARVARAVKLLEIGIMTITAIGWLGHSLTLLIIGIAGMGLHSTLFGPVKYAYLPQQLRADELVGGNGIIEGGTFVGILLGEVLGALLVELQTIGVVLVAGGTLTIAILGWLSSRAIPDSPAPVPELKINWNPLTETWRNLRFTRLNRPVFLSLLGNSWFWFYGAIILAQFPLFAKEYLHGDYSVFVLLLTVFSVGIGAGSLWCERLSGHKIEIGLVPFGSIGLTVFGIDLFFASSSYTNTAAVNFIGFVAQHGSLRILFDCVTIGVFGGLFIVPLFALIQTRCDPQHLSRTIAGLNILNALFIVAAALIALALIKAGCTIPQLFLVTALMNAAVAIYIFSLVPEFLMRFIAWCVVHTVYRIKLIDADRIPPIGAAVLVCNHVSYVDALVIMAASPRPVRFVMDHRIFAFPIVSWLFQSTKAIPIASAKDDPLVMEQAFAEIAQALDDGDLVCIFPEGRLTTDGELGNFKGGIQKIIDRSPVPVIPMALRGLWGSLLSRGNSDIDALSRRQGIQSRLTLVVGEMLPPMVVTLELLQDRVRALRGATK